MKFEKYHRFKFRVAFKKKRVYVFTAEIQLFKMA